MSNLKDITTIYDPSPLNIDLDYIRYINITSKHFDIQVLSSGYEKCNPAKAMIGPKLTSFYSVHLVVDGSGTLEVDNKIYKVNKNSIFIVKPNQLCSYKQDPENPWTYHWLTFNGMHASDLVKLCLVENSPPFFALDNKTVKELFNDFLNIKSTNNTIKSLKALSIFYKIFAVFGEINNTTIEHKELKGEEYTNKAIKFVEENFKNPELSTSLISNHLCIHQNYFSNIFKKYMNITFTKYLTIFRLNVAMKELTSTNKTISEISSFVGFNDALYFSKIFKAYYNFSPKKLRQLNLDT